MYRPSGINWEIAQKEVFYSLNSKPIICMIIMKQFSLQLILESSKITKFHFSIDKMLMIYMCTVCPLLSELAWLVL